MNAKVVSKTSCCRD